MPRKRSLHQQLVDAFMVRMGQTIPAIPAIPDVKVRELWARLVLEEALETVRALGFAGRAKIFETKMTIELEAMLEPDLVEIADGCLDVRFVATGTLSACGIADEKGQLVVDENNLGKFGPGHKLREDGKLIKPPDHKPPDIRGLLIEQGWKDG